MGEDRNRAMLDAALARAGQAPRFGSRRHPDPLFAPSSRSLEAPPIDEFLRGDYPASRFGALPLPDVAANADELVRQSQSNPHAPLGLRDVFTETAPDYIPGDGILPRGGPDEGDPVSPFTFEPADAPYDPAPFNVDDEWQTSGAARALYGFRDEDDTRARAVPYYIANAQERPAMPGIPLSPASTAMSQVLAQPTQDERDRRQAHELFAERERTRAAAIPLPGVAQIARPIVDAVTDPEARRLGPDQWLSNARAMLGMGDDGEGGGASIQWDEIMPRTRANIAEGMDPGIAALPAAASVIGDWWNDADNEFSRPSRMGRGLVDAGVDADYLLGGYLPDTVRGFVYPFLPQADEARQGLNWERAYMQARSDNGDGPQAFDASARNAYAGQMGATGIDAALSFAAPEALGAGGIRNIGLRGVEAVDDGVGYARQVAHGAPITLEGDALYPPRQDIIDAEFEPISIPEGAFADTTLQAERVDPIDPINTRADGRPLYGMRPDGTIASIGAGAGIGGGVGFVANELLNDEAYADEGDELEEGSPLLPVLGTALGAAGAARLFGRDGRQALRTFLQEANSTVGAFSGPAAQRRFLAAVRDPETGQVFTGLDHVEAIESAPGSARARLQSAYDADGAQASPDFGFAVDGQFMGREEGLASVRQTVGDGRTFGRSQGSNINANPQRTATESGTRAERFDDPRLSPQQRLAVEMRRNGFSDAEIADELQVNLNQVRQVFFQARKRAPDLDIGTRSLGRAPGWGAATIEQLVQRRTELLAEGVAKNRVASTIAREFNMADENVRQRLWTHDRGRRTDPLSIAIPLGAGGAGAAYLFAGEADAEEGDDPYAYLDGVVSYADAEDDRHPISGLSAPAGVAAYLASRGLLRRASPVIREATPLAIASAAGATAEGATGNDPLAGGVIGFGAGAVGAGARQTARQLNRYAAPIPLPREHTFRPDTIMRPEPANEALGRQVQEMVRRGESELPPMLPPRTTQQPIPIPPPVVAPPPEPRRVGGRSLDDRMAVPEGARGGPETHLRGLNAGELRQAGQILGVDVGSNARASVRALAQALRSNPAAVQRLRDAGLAAVAAGIIAADEEGSATPGGPPRS